MKKNTLIFFLLVVCLISCNKEKIITPLEKNSQKKETPNKIKRMGMVTGIKPEKITYYKKLHSNVWPGVLKKIKECNIQNYSIYIQKIEDKYYLFSYFEYTGIDFDADMKKMAADETTQKWWKETGPLQIPLPEAANKKETWANMEQVFHSN